MSSLGNFCIGCVLCCLALAPTSAVAQSEIEIAHTGVSTLRATVGGNTFEVNITTVQLKRSDPQFPVETGYNNEVSVVARLTIDQQGGHVYVPRSAFSDLYNARKVSLNFDKGTYILSIEGGDGADRYLTRTYFHGDKVTRRVVFVTAFGKTPAEATTYNKGETLY